MHRAKRYWLWLVCLLLIAVASLVHAAGSWNAQDVAPTLRQTQWLYWSDVLEPASPAVKADGRITRVHWQYHYDQWPSGLEACLCAAQQCVTLGSTAGQTKAFAGLPAKTAFKFGFIVQGKPQTFPPHYGQVSLVVDYQ